MTLGAAAGLTLLVRALGLLSQRVVLGEIGATVALDGYFIALVLPALIVTPIAAAIETGLTPSVARLSTDDPDAARALVRRVLLRASALGAVVSAGSLLLRGPLVYAMAPAGSRAELRAAEHVALWIFAAMAPQIISSVCRSVLYARDRYQAPVAVGVLNPAFMLGILLTIGSFDVKAVAQASAAGFTAEALVLLFLVRDVFRYRTAAVDAVPALSGLLTVVVSQLILRAVFYVDQAFASGLGEGAYTEYSIALRLYDAAVAVLILPNARIASVTVGRSNVAHVAAAGSNELRNSLKVGALAAVIFAVGSPLVISVFLQNGAFVGDPVRSTVIVALAFAAILPLTSTVHVGGRCLIAAGRNTLVFRLAVFQVFANLLLNSLLTPLLGHVGIVLATGTTHMLLSLLFLKELRSRRLVVP